MQLGKFHILTFPYSDFIKSLKWAHIENSSCGEDGGWLWGGSLGQLFHFVICNFEKHILFFRYQTALKFQAKLEFNWVYATANAKATANFKANNHIHLNHTLNPNVNAYIILPCSEQYIWAQNSIWLIFNPNQILI